MSTWQQRMWSFLQESAGIPAGIKAWVDCHAIRCHELLHNPQSSGISERSMIRWHRLGESSATLGRSKGELYGWREDSYEYVSTRMRCEALADLGYVSKRRVTVDLRSIDGMAESRADLTSVGSMADFARKFCGKWIDEPSLQKLHLNLSHHEVRIIRPQWTTDALYSYAWDGRIFLCNAGGSHHFATAQYMAAALQVDVPIEADLHIAALDSGAVATLCRQFDILLVDDLYTLHQAMKSFGATYYALGVPTVPQPPESTAIVFLPRDSFRSRRVAEVMLAGGVPDVGQHLTQLVACQTGHDAKLNTLNRAGEFGFDSATLRQRIDLSMQEHAADNKIARTVKLADEV